MNERSEIEWRDEIRRQIEMEIQQQPDFMARLRVAEAAEWIRRGAAGRALEVLEALLGRFEQADDAALPAIPPPPQDAPERLPCGCPVIARSLCPHGNSDLA